MPSKCLKNETCKTTRPQTQHHKQTNTATYIHGKYVFEVFIKAQEKILNEDLIHNLINAVNPSTKYQNLRFNELNQQIHNTGAGA